MSAARNGSRAGSARAGEATPAATRSGTAPAGRRRHPRAARIVAVIVALVVAWQFVATFAWNSSQTALTSLITLKALDAYMTPWFQQNWSVFAPDPVDANLSFDVRAKVSTDGTAHETGWYTVTDADITRGVLHKIVPSRDYLTNFQLVDDLYTAFDALPSSAQKVVAAQQTSPDWVPAVRGALVKDGVTTADAQNFSRYEDSAYRLATAVADVRWGAASGAADARISGVQVRLRSAPVRPFASRALGPSTTYSYFVDGWRAPLSIPDVNLGVIRALYGGGAK